MTSERKVIATLGTAEANRVEINATFHLDVKMTRRFIWMVKLKYIWAVIRAKTQ